MYVSDYLSLCIFPCVFFALKIYDKLSKKQKMENNIQTENKAK